MATRFAFVDDSGETRLAGFIVPEPGGGSIPDWWTVVTDPPSVEFAGLVTVSNPDSTVDDLSIIKIPATYVDDSNYGWLLRAAFDPTDPSTFVFAVGLDKLHFRSALGEGAGSLQIESTDDGGSVSLSTGGGVIARVAGSGNLLDLQSDDQPKSTVVVTPTAIGVFAKTETPAEQQTGVAVTAAAIHAALVAYGWITA